MEALNKRVTATVDQKTNVVTISVLMQDPLISAVLADTVVSRLQDYVTQYRTNKSRKDLEYAETLNEEAKVEYYKAQQKYADILTATTVWLSRAHRSLATVCRMRHLSLSVFTTRLPSRCRKQRQRCRKPLRCMQSSPRLLCP